MLKNLQIIRDNGGFAQSQRSCSRFFCTNAQYFTLTANTVKTVVVPPISATALLAYISYTPLTSVWVQNSATPTLTAPTGTVTATTAVLNPEGRKVASGQTLQFLTADTNVSVGIEYYAIDSSYSSGV